MSDKYVLSTDEKNDLIATMKKKLRDVQAYPSVYREGYADKLEKIISAYEGHPDAQIAIVREV